MPITITQHAGTGPYRRVYSNPGFAYSSAQVVLPPAADVQEIGGGLAPDGTPLKQPNSDQCYIYLGGWGNNGGAVDAGLIHSPAYGHWTAFMSVEGLGLHVDPTNTNLAPDQTVFLEFFVSADNVINLAVTGQNAAGIQVTVPIQLNPSASQGWNANGRGVIMKRMTTIGQSPEDLTSGSFIRNIHWIDCQIGVNKASAAPWGETQTGGFMSYPETEQVQIVYVSQSEETDTIVLAQPA